jgi:hypothetical protein
VSSFVRRLGGNVALLATAQADHARIYDGFFDNSSLIDYRAVAGTGVATMGRIDFSFPRAKTGIDMPVDVRVTWVNGDKTVPANSAGQGPIGAFPPKGDPVHVQYTCNIEHVALGGDVRVLDAYADFLDVGRVPRKTSGPCLTFSGTVATFTGLTAPRVTMEHADHAGAPARTLTPLAAARAGLAQMIAIGRRVIVQTDQDDRVTLSVRGTGILEVAPISARGRGAIRRYRLTGTTVRIAPPTRAGAAPVVRQGTRRLRPLRSRGRR